ncbi:hypothetical protein ZIOFF_009278 [Zingiber officinale]|uniref:HAT C-terminal dimerisation domain-containing protein n=1 Tax=Zingiber officinale TaxID=94328 RepID=A0A8J5HFD3_ZINOF|nr:hypothetical protein ZIOFF_009278 [Zingiber officinale]
MDVKTRWNATYKMLEVALKYRRVFERMTEEWLPFMNYFHQKDDTGKERIGLPKSNDWEMAKAFVHFLKKFYDATLEISVSKSPTSQLIYQSMVALQVEIDRKRHDDSDPILKEHKMKKSNFKRYPMKESTFSLGKRVVDPFGSSLSPKMVEALVCTSDWLSAEEFSFWINPTDDDLELYKEIEEIEKKHKYEIVKMWQARKHICGMTGGVNDAPALKKADISIIVADATANICYQKCL